MKKNILIVLFIYFVITFSYSQTITFNKTYNPYAYQEADNIVVYKDGYLMLGGGIDATESGQKVKIIAYYLDEYGTVNWMKTYGDTVYNYYFGDRNSHRERRWRFFPYWCPNRSREYYWYANQI